MNTSRAVGTHRGVTTKATGKGDGGYGYGNGDGGTGGVKMMKTGNSVGGLGLAHHRSLPQMRSNRTAAGHKKPLALRTPDAPLGDETEAHHFNQECVWVEGTTSGSAPPRKGSARSLFGGGRDDSRQGLSGASGSLGKSEPEGIKKTGFFRRVFPKFGAKANNRNNRNGTGDRKGVRPSNKIHKTRAKILLLPPETPRTTQRMKKAVKKAQYARKLLNEALKEPSKGALSVEQQEKLGQRQGSTGKDIAESNDKEPSKDLLQAAFRMATQARRLSQNPASKSRPN